MAHLRISLWSVQCSLQDSLSLTDILWFQRLETTAQVDDDDGHYIVVPAATIAEKWKLDVS